MFDRSKVSEQGRHNLLLPLLGEGGGQSLRREIVERGNTLLHNELTDGGTFTHTHTHTHTGPDKHALHRHSAKFISVLLCPLHTERLPTPSDPSLFSYDNAASHRFRLCPGV